MKKFLITLFCLVLLCSWVHAYNVIGKVYDTTFPWLTPVPNPTGTISNGSALQYITGYADASYSGGWAASNEVGNWITVSVNKGPLNGSYSWKAGSNNETGKDIFVKSTIALINPGLVVVAGPAHFSQPGLQDPTASVVYLNDPSRSFIATGMTAEIAYDESKLMLNNAFPAESFFDVFYEPNLSAPGRGTVTVNFNQPVPIDTIQKPLFNIEWMVHPFSNPDKTEVKLFDIEFTVDGENQELGLAMNNTSEIILGTVQECNPSITLDTFADWTEGLELQWPNEHIRPLTMAEWEDYRAFWEQPDILEGEPYFLPYPDTEFIDPCLYVYEGDGGEGDEPNDAGLVMKWGDDTTTDGNYASAWKFDYGLDPDLTNCTIQITITAKQFGLTGQINQVSFDMIDINGNRRGWWWSCGPLGSGAPIIWNVPTTVTINTSILGMTATTPMANGYASAAAFDITKVQSFDVDENGQWIFGQVSVPPPGQPNYVGLWNYWHNLIVTKNTSVGSNKGIYTKWSQPPVETTGPEPGVVYINGWDEWSNYNMPVMADDWECNDVRPITDIHWWGSFKGWNLRKPPSIMPKAFHIGIWTDVPKLSSENLMPDPNDSHPKELIWQNICTSYVWNFAGIDIDPQDRPDREGETCFQFTQLLNEDEWFYQHPMEDGMPNVYWLSIAPIWDADQLQSPDWHEWGWKTRPHYYNDDAIRIDGVTLMPLQIGSRFLNGLAIKYPADTTWDLSFELTTNEPGIPSADLNDSGLVDFTDFAIMADQWLTAGP